MHTPSHSLLTGCSPKDIKNYHNFKKCGEKLAQNGKNATSRKLILFPTTKKRNCRMVSVDEMQFGYMPDKGTIDAVFIFRRLLESIILKERCCKCVL